MSAALAVANLLDADADPAVSGHAVFLEISDDLERRFDRQGVDAAAFVNGGDHEADDFALGVEEGAADLSGRDGDVGADVGGGEVAVEVAEIESADKAECRRNGEIARVADGHDGEAGLERSRGADGDKGSQSLRNLEQGHAAAGIATENLGAHPGAVEFDAGHDVLAENRGGGQDGSLVVEEEAGSGHGQFVAFGTDANDGGAILFEDGVDLLANRVKDAGGWRDGGKEAKGDQAKRHPQSGRVGARTTIRVEIRRTAHAVRMPLSCHSS
jgi:hypothetical protein